MIFDADKFSVIKEIHKPTITHMLEDDSQSTWYKAFEVATTRGLWHRHTVTQLLPHSPCIIWLNKTHNHLGVTAGFKDTRSLAIAGEGFFIFLSYINQYMYSFYLLPYPQVIIAGGYNQNLVECLTGR